MAAAVTERIRIMTSVLVLPLHTTAVVAKQAASLDYLTGGRFALAVGSGAMSRTMTQPLWLSRTDSLISRSRSFSCASCGRGSRWETVALRSAPSRGPVDRPS